MADFNIAYPKTVSNEGYYVSEAYWRAHGDTQSGETYMGIDRRANPNWAGWAIIDKYKAQNGTHEYNFRFPVSLGLEDLVKQKAKTQYWDSIQGDKIANQSVAEMLFEQVWGGYGGIKRVQQVMNTMLPAPIGVDGSVGKDTLAAINSLPAEELFDKIKADRQQWINTVGAKYSPKDVGGWLSRLNRFTFSDLTDYVNTESQKVQTVIRKNPIVLVMGTVLIIAGIGLFYKYRQAATQVNQ